MAKRRVYDPERISLTQDARRNLLVQCNEQACSSDDFISQLMSEAPGAILPLASRIKREAEQFPQVLDKLDTNNIYRTEWSAFHER